MDNGSEFKRNFKPLLQTYGIKAKHISVKNPQANAILERFHPADEDMNRQIQLFCHIIIQDQHKHLVYKTKQPLQELSSLKNNAIDKMP